MASHNDTCPCPPTPRADLRYDNYFGDTSPGQLTSASYYLTTAGYLRFGWTAYPCTAKVRPGVHHTSPCTAEVRQAHHTLPCTWAGTRCMAAQCVWL
jgi:hypothetical protein